MYYVNVVISSLVLGFGFSTLIACLLLLRKGEKWSRILNEYMTTAMLIIKWVGLMVIALWLINLVLGLDSMAIAGRATGPYAWAYWMMALGLPVCSQLLWIRRVRASVIARVIIALGCIFTSGVFFEEFVILSTTIHRDESFRNADVLRIGMTYFTRIASFAGLVWLVQSVMARRKLNYNNN
ncbi:MAG: hypothetical protein AAFP76_10395 [Bacteroidota bacterium]